jgi:DtxR family transcriptional regulator, Mn-dependent transcriptional regulator
MDLEPGQEAVVTEVAGDPARAQQLSHYGLTPGISVTLTQKRPLPVIQVGRTDLALDAAVACQIYVSPDALDA